MSEQQKWPQTTYGPLTDLGRRMNEALAEEERKRLLADVEEVRRTWERVMGYPLWLPGDEP